MTTATKKQALGEAARDRQQDRLSRQAGATTRALTIVRGDALGNVAARQRVRVPARSSAKIGKPVDRERVGHDAADGERVLQPARRTTSTSPPASCSRRSSTASADDAVNYGGIGAVIGHELTHGFDDQGRQFDAEGNLRDWWTPADAKAFEKRAACVADEYSRLHRRRRRAS